MLSKPHGQSALSSIALAVFAEISFASGPLMFSQTSFTLRRDAP